MVSHINKREWNEAADVYAIGKTAIALPDDLCCPLLPDELKGMLVLDAGCGCGQVSRFLAQKGTTVIGVDISDALIAKAKADEETNPRGITYLVHDLIKILPFAEEYFDIAISVMTIMDIEHPLAAVQNIARTVRIGGLFIFSILHPCFYRPKISPDKDGFDLKPLTLHFL